MRPILFFLFLIAPCLGKDYISFDLGENEERDYKDHSLDLSPKNSDLSKSILFEFVSDDLLNIEKFWLEELKEGINCPNYYFYKNYDYLRYLFRLLALSYHYEGLKIFRGYDQRLGVKKSACETDYQELFNKCRPTGKDMGRFLSRVLALEKKQRRYSTFRKKTVRKILKIFSEKKEIKGSLGVINSGLRDWCFSKKDGCFPLKVLDIKKSIKKSCQKIRQNIQRICSEKDYFYGLSNISEMKLLLEFSHVLSLVDQGGHGRKCLERFVNEHKSKELKLIQFSKVVPRVLEHLRKKKSRYLQGDLFLYGSLKEFEEKGLDNFLISSTPKKKVKKKKKIKKKKKPIALTTKEKAVGPKKVAVKKKFEGSEFKKATFILKETGMSKLAVNMKKFKKDFLFSEDVALRLKVEFADFENFEILKRMRDEKNLGSKDLPVLLLYLKFLIEFKRHEALYNMINTLGDRFYVLNDLDDDPKVHLIELKNDEKTSWDWQIYVFK